MNKIIIIVALGVLLVLAGGVFLFTRPKKIEIAEPEKKWLEVEQFNTLPIKDRPYLSLSPSSSGGEIYLSVSRSNDALLEYEIEYQAINDQGGVLLQGGVGRLDLSSMRQPTKPKEFCFCSESKGKKKYDTGVEGGNIILRFSGGEKADYSLKGDFNIARKKDNDGVFSSVNGKVNLNLGAKDLADDTVVLISDTLGLPEDLENEILEGPVGFFVASAVDETLLDSSITFQSKKDLSNALILAWNPDRARWEELLDIKIDGETISAPANLLSTYILVLSTSKVDS